MDLANISPRPRGMTDWNEVKLAWQRYQGIRPKYTLPALVK